MDFPILDLMDETAGYQELLDLLHPDGLTGPRCGGGRDRDAVHRRRDGSPVVDYRCRDCRRVFSAFTGTPWPGTHRTPARILLILRGFTKGAPTAELARELKASRPHRLELRHAVPARAAAAADGAALPDGAVEADELYRNAGEKRRAAPRSRGPAAAAGRPGDRPRHLGHRPAAGLRGDGAAQRPAGAAGGAAELGGGAGASHGRAADAARGEGVHRRGVGVQAAGAAGRGHAAVNHNAGEGARDDDGDGIREVHCNTPEGIGTGLRNSLRPSRGVNKVYLEQYIKMFEWSYNVKAVTAASLRILLGAPAAASG